jgi:hypothetical protein
MNPQADDKQRQDEAVRRVVGIATLRKLHRMVDADAEQSAAQRARSRKLLAAILIVVALGLGFLLRDTLFS